MIKPTVGRKVWFIPSEEDYTHGPYTVMQDPDDETKVQPLDATIIAVHNDTLVNLMVIDIEGNQLFVAECELISTDTLVDYQESESYCTWMPYQVQQAAKSQEATVQPVTGIVV